MCVARTAGSHHFLSLGKTWPNTCCISWAAVEGYRQSVTVFPGSTAILQLRIGWGGGKLSSLPVYMPRTWLDYWMKYLCLWDMRWCCTLILISDPFVQNACGELYIYGHWQHPLIGAVKIKPSLIFKIEIITMILIVLMMKNTPNPPPPKKNVWTPIKSPAVWRRIRWRGLPPRSPTWPRPSWPRSPWWSHWAELTASRLFSRRGTNHQRQLMNITPCNASERSAQLSSHSSLRLPPLIPALMNQTQLSLSLSLRSSRAGETPSASTSRVSHSPSLAPLSSFAPAHLIKVWLMRMFPLSRSQLIPIPGQEENPSASGSAVAFGDG